MASIINAGTSGVTITGSSSAALNIQVGGTNAIQIGTAATATLSTTTFPSGTASAPAIAITGDTDTGIYAPAANQLAVSAGGTVAAAFNSNGLFFRNRIINGDMRIDQRNAGAAVTVNDADNLRFPVDRFAGIGTPAAGVFTLQQSTTAPTGFVNSIIATVTTSATPSGTNAYNILQNIEGLNIADLGWGTANALPVTLSFWVRSSVTGTFGGAIRNSASNRSYPFSYTISSANTWEYKSVTIPGDTSGTWLTTNGIGLRPNFSLGAGSDRLGTAGAWSGSNLSGVTGQTNLIATNGATFYITGVQLETGSVATPFERRPFGTELQLCQRYYEKSYDQSVAPGSASTSGYSSGNNPDQGTAVYIITPDRFAVTKRTSATMRVWDLAGNLNRTTQYTLGGLVRTDNANNIYTYTGYQSNAVMIFVVTASTASTYQWDASAEL
jgi:hypothetical protein